MARELQVVLTADTSQLRRGLMTAELRAIHLRMTKLLSEMEVAMRRVTEIVEADCWEDEQ